jgi:cytochrome c553
VQLRHSATAAAVLIAVAGLAVAAPSDPPPSWAFPLNPPEHPDPAFSKDRPEHVPGSALMFTDGQLDDHFFTADWFPRSHPPMPPVVAVGRKPDVTACSFCHLPTGQTGAEAASLAGMPAGYIVEQVVEMREGRRRAAEPKMLAPNGMMKEARAVNLAELKAAADYFSHLTFRSHVRVVEVNTVPKTHVAGVSWLAPITGAGAGAEPIGARIIEVAENPQRYLEGDFNFAFLAYAPRGSLRRGEALVASGDGAAPCRACHGADLKGMGMIPGLAGRSPSYLVRQLYDIQHGTRRGAAVAPMLPEVAHMTPDDRIAIAAYLASLKG